VIRSVHNSFSKSDTFISDRSDSSGEKEDLFHFISYVPVDGHIYELDGLKAGPINVSRIGGNRIDII